MTITARYPGRCAKCGGAINPGDRINWDKATRRTEHAQCPERPAVSAQSGATRTNVRTNRKPGACERCGHYLQSGQGRLVYCIEDAGCPVHHDYAGYHLYCLDEDACNQRREEARKKQEAIRAEVAALQATITTESADVREAEELVFVPRGMSAYLSHTWYRLPNGTVAVGFWRPAPFDEWERVVLRTTASVEQVLAAKASGALAKVKLD